MTRCILNISMVIILSSTAWGQNESAYNKLVAEGNRYFADEQFHLAAELYRDAISLEITDPAVDYKLAECYRKTFDYREAEGYYLKVCYTGQSHFPLALFYYALMLKLNGNIPESIERFDHFIALHQQNPTLATFVEQAIIEKAGCEIALQELVSPFSVPTHGPEEGINSAYNDFAPAFRDPSTLVITSTRVNSNRDLIDHRNGEGFSDLYYFTRDGSQWQDRTRKEFAALNTLYHDGSGSFTQKGDQYFFTVCEERCRIFESHFANNKWTKPVALNENINLPSTEAKQPAISPGGDTLYFVSDRLGGYGKFDIWMSIDAGDNDWQTPLNAGSVINTQGNDLAPAISTLPAVLFFSSDGHPGYGGLDLFAAQRKSSGDTVLYNLDRPFNSAKDDCFLTFNNDELFWSSNRDGGKGGFDVYAARNASALTLLSRLSLRNRNDSRMVTLSSRTARSESINLLASRNEERIDYNDLTYERKALVNRMVDNRIHNKPNRREDFLEVSADEFEALNEISHTRFKSLLLKQKYASTLLTEVVQGRDNSGASAITGQLVEESNGSPLRHARILLTNEDGDILKITRTNYDGHFRFTDVPGDSRLFLRLENASAPVVTAVVRDIVMMRSTEDNSVYVENVYFDFDHYIIRPEAAQVLTDLAGYLKANPGAQVEIYAFADDRGSSEYNIELTQKRGEAVVAFLARQGVDATSLAIIPKGKQDMRRAVSEVQRQYSRRAEFHVNGVTGNSFSASAKTYILKREADWGMIARMTGIPKEKLQTMNGSQTDIVKAFQPVRVPVEAKDVSDELFFVGI